MSLILIVSIFIRLVAMGWSVMMTRRLRYWQALFLTATIGLMALRQILELWAGTETGEADWLDLTVSIMILLAVFFLERTLIERSQAQKALQTSEDKFRVLVENAPDVIMTLDREGTILFINYTLPQYSVEEVFGTSVSNYLSAEDWGRYKQALDEVFEFQEPRSLEVKAAGDTSWLVRLAPIKQNGKSDSAMVIATDITERKQAEHEIRESESRFQQLIEQASDAIYLHEIEGRIVEVNQQACDSMGYTREELLELSIPDIDIHWMRDGATEALKRMASGASVTGERALRRKDGTIFPGEVRAGLVEFGGRQMILGLVRDITERKLAEEKIRESEELFRTLAESSSAGIYIYRGTKYLYANSTAEHLTGYTREELLSMDIWIPVHPDYRELVRERSEARQAGENISSHYEIKLLTKTGQELWSDVTATVISFQGQQAVLVTSFDITERKLAEEALRVSERKYKDIFELAPIGIYQSSPDGAILTANRALAEMLEYESADELLEANLAKDIYFNEEERRKLIDEYESVGAGLDVELRWKKKDGTPIWISLNAHSIMDAEGRTQYYEGFVREITERRQTEEALRESEERFRMLSECTLEGILIHELGVIVDANQSLSEMSLYSLSELIGMNGLDLITPEYREMSLNSILSAVDAPLEVEGLRKDGTTIPLEIHPKAIPYKGRDLRMLALRDITERKLAEDALRASEERFSKAFHASPHSMVISSLDEGRYLDVNGSYLQITGYDREEVIGRTSSDLNLWVDADDRARVVETLKEQGSVSDMELKFRRKSGEEFIALFSAEIIRLDGKECLLTASTDITERKRIEEAVRQQREWLRVTLASIGDAVIATDTEGHVTFMNPIAEAATGWEQKDAVGNPLKNVFNIVNEDTREPVESPVAKVMQSGVVVGLANHTLLIARDGREISVDDSGAPIKDEHGNIIGVVLVFHDITERKQAEESLRESENRFRMLSEASFEGILIHENGIILEVNKAFTDMSGYELSELVGASVLNLVNPESEEAVAGRLQAPSDKLFEVSARRKDGSNLIVETASRDLPYRGRNARVTAVRDITERKIAEEKQARLQADVYKSAREWRLTFDSVESPLLVLDLAGNIIRLNQAARQLAAIPYENALKLHVGAVASGQPWQKAADLVNRIRQTRSRITSLIQDESNGKSWDIIASMFAAPDGDERIIIAARDITQTVKLQESLRRSETMSAMGALVAGVAHEVRNPLFSISATLDAFEARFGARGEYRRHLNVLRGEVDRLNQLMGELLEYGRPHRLELVKDSIEGAIAQAVASCTAIADRMRVRINNRVTGTMERVMMDRKRMAQVFQNLIENAIQHSAAEGEVRIEVKEEKRNGQTWISCEVKDDGPGFGVEELTRAFEPFYTRRRGGTGLGLSIVLRIVEEHGGEVRAGNREEGGAKMEVRLPCARE